MIIATATQTADERKIQADVSFNLNESNDNRNAPLFLGESYEINCKYGLPYPCTIDQIIPPSLSLIWTLICTKIKNRRFIALIDHQ